MGVRIARKWQGWHAPAAVGMLLFAGCGVVVRSDIAPSSLAADGGATGYGGRLLLWSTGLAVAGLLTGFVLWRRQRTIASTWERRLEAARADLAWVVEDLLSRMLSSPVAEEAAPLWQAGRPRIRRAQTELGTLSVEAEPAGRRAAAAALLVALTALVAAGDAAFAPPTDATGERLHARAEVEAAVSELRAALSATGEA